MDLWPCLQRVTFSAWYAVCPDRLPMFFLSLQLVSSCAHGEPAVVHVLLCYSCLKTSALPSESRNHAQWNARRLSNRRRGAVVIHAFVAPGGRISARSFRQLQCDDLLQRQLYCDERAFMRVWLFRARFMASSKTCEGCRP
jgi:hypothetical protein